jgi:choline dehydrogenase-like flavoprotein
VIYADGKVSGVEATYSPLDSQGKTEKIVIKAKVVVVCCGSINTPALLLRSGLENPNIGKNLRLHPVALVNV